MKRHARKKKKVITSSCLIGSMSWECLELSCLFFDSEMCQVMLEMDQEYSLHLSAKNVLVSAASFNELLKWFVLKDRSLGNVPKQYPPAFVNRILYFSRKRNTILLWSNDCNISSISHWLIFNMKFSLDSVTKGNF